MVITARFLGGVGPETPVLASSTATSPPLLIMVVTGCVVIGALVNLTDVLNSATDLSISLAYSGYLIGTYSIGAFLGLFLFFRLEVQQLRTACLFHTSSVFVGNTFYAVALYASSDWLEVVSRIVVGVEYGAIYNTILALSHFAKGPGSTTYFMIFQLFVGVGVTTGTAFASLCTEIASWVGASDEDFSDAVVNIVMACWGATFFISLLIFFPGDWEQVEALAKTSDVSATVEFIPAVESTTEVSAEENTRVPQVIADALATASDVSATVEVIAGESTTEVSAEEKPHAQQHIALMLVITSSSFLRITQRLLWESGAMVVFVYIYGWSSTFGGYMIGAVGVTSVVSQLLFSACISGACDDSKAMRCMDITALCGLVLLFAFGHHQDAEVWEWTFMLGSIISYCSNMIWGGIVRSFCVKRAVPRTLSDSTNLLVADQVSIVTGILVGCVFGRLVLNLVLTQNSLACCMLFISVMQFMCSLLVFEWPK